MTKVIAIPSIVGDEIHGVVLWYQPCIFRHEICTMRTPFGKVAFFYKTRIVTVYRFPQRWHRRLQLFCDNSEPYNKKDSLEDKRL